MNNQNINNQNMNSKWLDKYRPTNITQFMCTKRRKEYFQSIIEKQKLPNLLLFGDFGIGKTTIGRLIGKELGKLPNYLFNIYRNSTRFLSSQNAKEAQGLVDLMTSPSLWSEQTEIWILDEFDKLQPKYQQRFLGVLEDNTHKNGFIITANNIGKIDGSIKSRCFQFCMDLDDDDKDELIGEMIKLGKYILDAENIKFSFYDLKDLSTKRWDKPRVFVDELENFTLSGELKPF